MSEFYISADELDTYLSFNEVCFGDNFENGSVMVKNNNTIGINDTGAFIHFYYEIYDKNNIEKLLISRKNFQELLIDLYIEMKTNNTTEIEVMSRITEIQVLDCKVLLPIYYVHLFENRIEIGDFLFIKYQDISRFGSEIMPKGAERFSVNATKDQYFNNIPFLVINIRARDFTFAYEQAQIKLEEFIHFLNYAIYSHQRVNEPFSSVSNFGTSERKYIFSQEQAQLSTSGHSPMVKRLTLSELKEYLLDENSGNKQLIDILARGANNEIEKRIINAVNWIGMAVAEKNNSIAFTQAVFAIEGLLQYDTKGELINKSIVASISEQVAFLLGHNYEERKTLEKRLKQLYKMRSMIAHGKGTDISVYDVLEVIVLAKSLVCELLVNPAIKDAKTMVMITNYIEKLRYTVGEEDE